MMKVTTRLFVDANQLMNPGGDERSRKTEPTFIREAARKHSWSKYGQPRRMVPVAVDTCHPVGKPS